MGACSVSTSGVYTDLGITLQHTTATIADFIAGTLIDHVIDIGPDCRVRIDHATITGSTIYYADGIRSSNATVTIVNSTIVRPPMSEPAGNGVLHDPPYAG